MYYRASLHFDVGVKLGEPGFRHCLLERRLHRFLAIKQQESAAPGAKELAAKTSETTKDAYEKAKKEVGPALEKAQKQAGEAYQKAKEATKEAYEKAKDAAQPQQN